MNTPICEFVQAYAARDPLRLHMPGHKGIGAVESRDITEIAGADVLYRADGIIAESEANAAAVFGTAKTVYSTEGSSLAIRAMLYLTVLYARERGVRPRIAAGRNAHTVFMTAAALLDVDVEWLYGSGLLTCDLTPNAVEQYLQTATELPTAVYVTSPDYLGTMVDIGAIAAVCHRYNVLLLVDNAHGAYLGFLPESCHPIALGADACCDSAHKTLPVLTGGAYLHLSETAPAVFHDRVRQAMALFASTSPSYLILQSLDAANRYVSDGYRARLALFAEQVHNAKKRLRRHGYMLCGTEPLKITVAAKAYGYTGTELAAILAEHNAECEFADPDYLVMMVTPATEAAGLDRLCDVLTAIPMREPLCVFPPSIPRLVRRLTPREALLSPAEPCATDRCAGKILATPSVSCPPAVPIAVCGEELTDEACRVFAYYGITWCDVVKEY